MAFDFEPAKRVLSKHTDEIKKELDEIRKDVSDITTGSEYLTAFTNATTAPNPAVDDNDRRLASQMAVDMSKTFVEIALAGIAALVAYSQVAGYPTGFGLSFWAWVVTFLSFVLSMIAGALVISEAAKRGGGKRPLEGKPPWDIDAVKSSMNKQALVGLFGVVSFIVLVVVQHSPSIAKRFEVDLPGGCEFVTSGQIEIHGEWQSLYVEDKRTGYISQLGPTKVGQNVPIKITPK